MLKLSKKTHRDLIKNWQSNPAFVRAYDDLTHDFSKSKDFKHLSKAILAIPRLAVEPDDII